MMKGQNTKAPLDAQPKFPVVPAALEMLGEHLLCVVAAATVADVNRLSGRLDLKTDNANLNIHA